MSERCSFLIDELFHIESMCVTGPPGDAMRAQLRAERSRPLVKQIEQWALSVRASPQSPLRKAVEYMGNMWRGLVLFLEDPAIALRRGRA
jgi:transposase